MSVVYEKIVAEDLELGRGTVSITNPAGGSLVGSKIGIHTFHEGPIVTVSSFGGADVGAQIQAAHDALPAAGGTIILDFATGKICTSEISFTKPVRMIGLGVGATELIIGTAGNNLLTLTDAVGSVLRDFKITGSGSTVGTNLELAISVTSATPGSDQNVEIRNLEITNCTTAIYVHDAAKVRVSGCYIHDLVWNVDNSEGYGVLVEGSDGVTVDNNVLDGVPRHAIYFSGAADFVAHSNRVFNNHGSAINAQGDATGVGWTERGIIYGNIISTVTRDSGQTIPSRGINVSGSARQIVVANNEIYGTEDEGIEAQGNDTYADPVNAIKISGNRVTMAGAMIGIAINRARDCMVSDNFVEGDGSATPLITVAGSATHAATENVLRGNTIKNSQTGISVNDDANTTGTIIDGNTLIDCTTAITAGLTSSEWGWNSENGYIISRGVVGINTVPGSDNYSLHLERTFTTPSAEIAGLHSRMIGKDTSAPNASALMGIRGIARIDPANTQNWTSSTGVVGLMGEVQVGTGATGIIANVSPIFSAGTIAAGTVTAYHGVHVEAPTGAGTITTKRGVYVKALAGISEFLGGIMIDVVATGSLPAAGATQNGRILIEDNGAGDRNLVIYAGNQRFRIDGGAAF